MRIEAIDRETSIPPTKNRTKCTKMTDESDSIIKNGINGAVAGCGAGGVGATIHVSRGSAISSSGSGGTSATITVGSGSTNLRMQYSSSGGEAGSLVVNEQNHNQVNQETNAGVLPGGGGGSNTADAVRSPNPGIGGRLQFFKDGKFILELARAREGERAGWVSVPRKTYWPPSATSAATTNSNYPKNESSTSLSFSDDNSSIQSSPWQRDHCWKQASPRKAVSKEMCMFFKRTNKFALSHDGYKTAQLKRRRPHDNSICKIPFTLVKNGFIKTELVDANDIKKESEEDGEKETNTVEGAPTIKIENNKINEQKKPKCRAKLSTILEKLIDRLPTGLFYLSKVTPPSGIVNHFSSTPSRITEVHNHQQHVSPRKRILRELEKVSLEDNSTKRSRAKNNVTTISPLIPTSPSNAVSQIPSTATNSQRITFQNNGNTQVANGNGNVNESNAISGPNSSRLYSSYSIHSLLGNTCNSNSNKTDSNIKQNSKDGQDPSCLRIMLTSPNSSENYYGSRNTYTSGGGKRKSPNYCMPQDSHNHNRRSSRESPNNYGSNHPSESSLSPDPINRYKPSSNTSVSTSFHPYLSSPKYSPNTVSPNTINDNYKQKSGYASGSPSHQHMTAKLSSTSRSSTVSSYSQQSPHSSKTSNMSSNSRLREQSPGENLSPSSTDRRDGTPRTVPKKTVALRQQYSSPTSSQSIVHGDSSSVYKSPSEQKRKNIEEQRTLSPENKMYHSPIDMEQHRPGSLIRASPVMTPSSFYYFHPPHGSPGTHSGQPPYIPSMSYYPISSYAAAVAALRNPLWMHYQTGILPGPPPRLSFPYNGESGLGPPSTPGVSSMHLSSGPITPWPPLVQNSATDDPVSLVNVKDEHNADVPLNLSKH